MNLPEKITNIQPYEVFNPPADAYLNAGESFINIPVEIHAKMISAAATVDLRRYPDSGAADLCAAAADSYGVRPENIVAGNGSDELISLICSAFVAKSGKLLTAAPDFSMYRFYAELSELEIVSAPKSELRLDSAMLIDSLRREAPDSLFFSNPCNPTGQVLPKSEILGIVRAAECLVVVDEAYIEFSPENSVAGEVEDFDNLIVLRTCSKAVGIAGLRVGFAVASPALAGYLRAAKSPYNVNAVSQAMAAVLLRERDFLRYAAGEIIASRDYLYLQLCQIADKGTGTTKIKAVKTESNFALLKCENAQDVYEKLLSRSVLVRHIMGDYLRVTAGNRTEDDLFLAELGRIIG